ncbi:MAG: hypothetical protein KIS86_01080 [Devosia sp.]|nr:hypothetical protein [Devosia sp.]
MADAFARRRRDGDVIVAIALAQAQTGDVEGGIATAAAMEDPELRGIALAAIAPFMSSPEESN